MNFDFFSLSFLLCLSYVSYFIIFGEISSVLPTKLSIVFLHTAIIFIIFQEFVHIFLIILSDSFRVMFWWLQYLLLFHGGYYLQFLNIFSSLPCNFCFFQVLLLSLLLLFSSVFHNQGVPQMFDKLACPFYLRTRHWDFPGCPVVKIPCLHCRGHGLDLWSGN